MNLKGVVLTFGALVSIVALVLLVLIIIDTLWSLYG